MSDFPSDLLERTAHRPWPVPRGPWIMTQTWLDLLFAHWRVDRAALRALVPRELELDLFDGSAWVGVVPFRMTNVAPRGVPALPFVSSFHELNVRTYVTRQDKAGVYFFSLDADSVIAVTTARTLFRLPYFLAEMAMSTAGETVTARSRRTGADTAEWRASYKPVGPVRTAAPGTLEHFLTERYCLYTAHEGRASRLEIHHPAWPLQGAEVVIDVNTMSPSLAEGPPAVVHFAGRQDALAWPPERIT